MLADGLESLVALHWDEVALDKDTIPLGPDWEGYREDERRGVFKGIAARRDGRLIGYNCFWVMTTRHYRKTLHALNDVLYIDPDERGLAGLLLVMKSERMLGALAPTIKIIYHTKLHGELAKVGELLEKLGYRHIENVYAKVLT